MYKKLSRKALKGNWSVVVLVVLIGILINGISSGTTFINNDGLVGTIFNNNFLISIALLPLIIGKTRIYYDISLNKSPDLAEILKGFRDGYYLKNLGALFLKKVYIFLWALLFIIPGIVKAYSYSMTAYILQDDDFFEDDYTAIETSVQLMDGNKMKLFLLDLSFVGWYLLSILTFGLLLFYVIPYHKTAVTFLYNDIKKRADITK